MHNRQVTLPQRLNINAAEVLHLRFGAFAVSHVALALAGGLCSREPALADELVVGWALSAAAHGYCIDHLNVDDWLRLPILDHVIEVRLIPQVADDRQSDYQQEDCSEKDLERKELDSHALN